MWGEHVDATNLLSRCAAAEWHFFWLPVTTLASCRLGSSTSNKLPPARPHCSSAFTPHGTYGVQHNPTRAVSVTSVCLILCVCVCVCVLRAALGLGPPASPSAYGLPHPSTISPPPSRDCTTSVASSCNVASRQSLSLPVGLYRVCPCRQIMRRGIARASTISSTCPREFAVPHQMRMSAVASYS